MHDHIFSLDAFPTGEGESFAGAYREAGGGPAATAAVTIVRLGGRAILFSRVGQDSVGERIIADLDAEGVETGGILVRPGQSTVSSVLLDGWGRRMIVNHRDPALPRDPAGLPLEQIGQAQCVLADMRWGEGAMSVLERAKALGVPRVLDADVSDDALAPDLPALASHIVFSRTGLAALAGNDKLEPGLRDMQDRTGAFVAVTDGENGSICLEDGTPLHIPAIRVDRQDTAGAGDVFHGSFSLALAGGKSEIEALNFASTVAALKCTRPGGREGIPTAAELLEFMGKSAR